MGEVSRGLEPPLQGMNFLNKNFLAAKHILHPSDMNEAGCICRSIFSQQTPCAEESNPAAMTPIPLPPHPQLGCRATLAELRSPILAAAPNCFGVNYPPTLTLHAESAYLHVAST